MRLLIDENFRGELPKNDQGLYLMPYELSWDAHEDDHEVRAARSWKLCVEQIRQGMIWVNHGTYLRNVWTSNYNRLGTPLFWHPLCSPWRDMMVQGLAYYKDYFMGEENEALLKQLPDELTVYRGYSNCPNGCSWSLLKEVAEGFGDEVRSMKVSKDKVFAYLNDRDEQEVIILEEFDPRDVCGD